jgi:hypothetical protein
MVSGLFGSRWALAGGLSSTNDTIVADTQIYDFATYDCQAPKQEGWGVKMTAGPTSCRGLHAVQE